MKIGNKEIGNKNPCFIIAELSANHNGSLEVAIETIRAAKKQVQMLLNYRPIPQIQ